MFWHQRPVGLGLICLVGSSTMLHVHSDCCNWPWVCIFMVKVSNLTELPTYWVCSLLYSMNYGSMLAKTLADEKKEKMNIICFLSQRMPGDFLELSYNWCINNLFVVPSEMMFDLKRGGELCNVIMHNVSWANQKTESCLNCWLWEHAMFDVTCFPIFVGALYVISSVLSTVPTKSLETTCHFPIIFHCCNTMSYQIYKTPMHFQTL